MSAIKVMPPEVVESVDGRDQRGGSVALRQAELDARGIATELEFAEQIPERSDDPS